MKSVFKYIVVASAMSLLAVGCYPEVVEVDASKLPVASELEPDYTIDEETNEVTFFVKDDTGIVPMWIFSDIVIDGRANSTHAYRGNYQTVLLNEKGLYEVELKAYNSHGISMDSQIVSLTTKKEIPYDDGSWDGTEKANLWLKATPEVSSNAVEAEYPDGNGYLATLPEPGSVEFKNIGIMTSSKNKYQLQVVFIPTCDSPETRIRLGDDNVAIVDTLVNLRERRRFVFQASDLQGQDITNLDLKLEFPKIAEAAEVQIRNIYIGESTTEKNPDIWDATESTNMWMDMTPNVTFWFADNNWGQISNPDWTDDTDLTDGSKYTVVIPEGIGSTQWQGQVHFNNTGLTTSAGKKYDFQVVLKASEAVPGATIKLSKDGDDNTFYTADRHDLPAKKDFIYQMTWDGIDIPSIKLSFDFAGATPGTVIEISDILISEHQDNHIAVIDGTGEDNLWLGMNSNVAFWFADGSWSQISDPEWTNDEDLTNGIKYVVVIPEGMGSDQWQGQVHFNNTGITTSAGKKYEFQVVLEASENIPGATIKLSKDGDDNTFYTADRHDLTKGVPFLFHEVYDGIDIPSIKLSFDFAGAPAGTKVVIRSIVLRETI